MTPPVSLHSQETGLPTRKTPLFRRVSSNISLPLHFEGTCGQKKPTVNPVSHCPQVIYSYISWQTVTTDKSFAQLLHCALTLSTDLMGFVKMWATRKSEKQYQRHCKSWEYYNKMRCTEFVWASSISLLSLNKCLAVSQTVQLQSGQCFMCRAIFIFPNINIMYSSQQLTQLACVQTQLANT